MAWQLLYTSAPRLLEAGRSGFGTIARHREIPPLVAAAVERISQFSRQPGLDPGRVIYAHRVLSVSGQRFHVLSCTRDAGADYTGRTNHLAHHLVATPEEVAALGISAAEALLQMPWRTHWAEVPRWLESEDQVVLSAFLPVARSDGAHWAAVTGEAQQAALLVTGEAAHGCYLVGPPGADLRPLFADSLQLAPERRWQVPFTTSYQPSDEPTDFRWLGLEAGSPLRAGIETSGRPVLDLTAPHTLPMIAVPSPAQAAAQMRSAGALSAVNAPAFREGSRVSRPNPRMQVAVPAPPRRAMPMRLWIGVAAAILIAFASIAGVAFFRRGAIQAERAELIARLPEFARTGAMGNHALDGLRWSNRGPARALAAATEAVHFQLETGKLEGLDPAPLLQAVNAAESAGLNVSAYRDVLNVATEASTRRDLARQPKPPDAALDLDEALRRKLTLPLPAGAVYKTTREMLQNLWLEREARALAGALQGPVNPREDLRRFEGVRQALRDSSSRGLPPPSLAQTDKWLEAWRRLAIGQPVEPQNSWPDWLREFAHPSQRTAALPRNARSSASLQRPGMTTEGGAVPVYLAVGLDHLRHVVISELRAQVKFSVIEGGQAQPLVTIKESVRRSVTTPAIFQIDLARQLLIAEPAAATLALPIWLRVVSAEDQPLAEIHIVGGNGREPLLPPRAEGLTRDGEQLRVDLTFAPRTTLVRWLLQLPGTLPEQALPIEGGVVELREALRLRERAIEDRRTRLAAKKKILDELNNPRELEDRLAQQCAELDGIFPLAVSDFGGVSLKPKKGARRPAATRPEPIGDALAEFGGRLQRISKQIVELGAAGQAEALRQYGAALEKVGRTPAEASDAVRKATAAVSLFAFKNDDLRREWRPRLEQLKAACGTAAALAATYSDEAQRLETQLQSDVATLEKEIAAHRDDPWKGGRLPPGDYGCLVEYESLRVPITVFRIP
jgi:hypothetical protein